MYWYYVVYIMYYVLCVVYYVVCVMYYVLCVMRCVLCLMYYRLYIAIHGLSGSWPPQVWHLVWAPKKVPQDNRTPPQTVCSWFCVPGAGE